MSQKAKCSESRCPQGSHQALLALDRLQDLLNPSHRDLLALDHIKAHASQLANRPRARHAFRSGEGVDATKEREVEPNVSFRHALRRFGVRARLFRPVLGSSRATITGGFGFLDQLLPFAGTDGPDLVEEVLLRDLEAPDLGCPAGEQAQDPQRAGPAHAEEDLAILGEALEGISDVFGARRHGREPFQAEGDAPAERFGARDPLRGRVRIQGRLDRVSEPNGHDRRAFHQRFGREIRSDFCRLRQASLVLAVYTAHLT